MKCPTVVFTDAARRCGQHGAQRKRVACSPKLLNPTLHMSWQRVSSVQQSEQIAPP